MDVAKNIRHTFDGRNVYWCGEDFANKYDLNWKIIRLQIITGRYNHAKKFINPEDKKHIRQLTGNKDRVGSVYGISIRTVRDIFRSKRINENELESYKDVLREFIKKRKHTHDTTMDDVGDDIEEKNENKNVINNINYGNRKSPNERNVPSIILPPILDHIKNDSKRSKIEKNDFINHLYKEWMDSINNQEWMISGLMDNKNNIINDNKKIQSFQWFFDENEKEFILHNTINIKK